MYRISIMSRGRITLDVDVPERVDHPTPPAGEMPIEPDWQAMSAIETLITSAFRNAARELGENVTEELRVRIQRYPAELLRR